MAFIYSALLAGVLCGGLFVGTCHQSPFNIFDVAPDDRGIVIVIYAFALGFSIVGMLVAFFAQFGLKVGRARVAVISRWKGWGVIACLVGYLAMCWILSRQFCS